MANKKKKRKGNPFHKPQRMGEKTPFKATPLLHVLSAVSLLVQVGLTVLAAVGYHKFFPLNIAGPFRLNAAYMFWLLPLVIWVITIVARLGFRTLPLDMWRMPIDVRKGMVVCNGWLLKLTTLLVELECAVAFTVIEVGMYTGFALNDIVMDIVVFGLLAVLVVTVWLPCRRAGKIGRGEVRWGKAED